MVSKYSMVINMLYLIKNSRIDLRPTASHTEDGEGRAP